MTTDEICVKKRENITVDNTNAFLYRVASRLPFIQFKGLKPLIFFTLDSFLSDRKWF